jgi:uncharacterized protein
MPRSPSTIALLCKAPIPGFAKTGLIPHLGEMDTAHLQEELVMQAVITALDASVGPVELWCDPDETHPFFGKIMKKYPVRLTSQPPGDKGTRLHTCASGALVDADAVILMSVDCPVMPSYYLEEAAAALARGCDAVVGPSEDGSYVLLGLKRANEELFSNISWGTSLVLSQTQDRIARLSWRSHTLATLWDVDTPADYQRWRMITDAMPNRPEVQRL